MYSNSSADRTVQAKLMTKSSQQNKVTTVIWKQATPQNERLTEWDMAWQITQKMDSIYWHLQLWITKEWDKHGHILTRGSPTKRC